MFGRIGPFELILILRIALIIFGPSKLPQIGKSLGQAITEFRKGTAAAKKEFNDLTDDTVISQETAATKDKKDDNA